MRKLLWFAVLGLFSAPIFAYASVDPETGPASMDGVWIEAVESYPSVRKDSIDFALGIYAFDPYFNAFTFSAAYTHAFSRSLTWELLNFDYMFTVQKGLREKLADQFQVQPSQIERPNFVLSSNVFFMQAFGKFIYSDDRVRYFRAGPMVGAGLFNTSFGSFPTLNVGLRFDLHVSPTFSWKIDIRDHIAMGTTSNGATAETAFFDNFIFFSLVGGLSF